MSLMTNNYQQASHRSGTAAIKIDGKLVPAYLEQVPIRQSTKNQPLGYFGVVA